MDSDIQETLDDSNDEKLDQDVYAEYLHPDDEMAVIFSIDKTGDFLISHKGRRWDKEMAEKLALLLYSIHCGNLAVDNWAIAEALKFDKSKEEFVNTLLDKWLSLLQNAKKDINIEQPEEVKNTSTNTNVARNQDRPIVEPWYTLKPKFTNK